MRLVCMCLDDVCMCLDGVCMCLCMCLDARWCLRLEGVLWCVMCLCACVSRVC